MEKNKEDGRLRMRRILDLRSYVHEKGARKEERREGRRKGVDLKLPLQYLALE